MSHKDIVKKYGEGVLMDASFLAEEKKVIIPVTPALDIHLHGGIPEGTVATFSGKEGSGKTTTALQIAANAQKEEYGSRKIFYDDVEHRLKKSTLDGIHGLDYSPNKFEVIHSTKDKILSAEDHLNIVLLLLKEQTQSIFIIDSTSALCGDGEMNEDVKSDFRNASPKLIANFCRHIMPIVFVNKHLVMLTQHLITDTSGKGLGYQEDGGTKIKHASDYRLRIKYIDKWMVGSGENEKCVGQILHWTITKSPYGVIDKIDSYLRYGYGLDDVSEIINLACDIGLIVKGGSWFTMEFLESKQKLQGQENVYQFLKTNVDAFEQLKTAVKESLK